mmetsp:Transcript_10299/g.20848  ORF Transcript_10299/g.20848 Transcript_10299/m.20848 type:complete len:287 (+) Transcript_10299:557-1417(+)
MVCFSVRDSKLQRRLLHLLRHLRFPQRHVRRRSHPNHPRICRQQVLAFPQPMYRQSVQRLFQLQHPRQVAQHPYRHLFQRVGRPWSPRAARRVPPLQRLQPSPMKQENPSLRQRLHRHWYPVKQQEHRRLHPLPFLRQVNQRSSQLWCQVQRQFQQYCRQVSQQGRRQQYLRKLRIRFRGVYRHFQIQSLPRRHEHRFQRPFLYHHFLHRSQHCLPKHLFLLLLHLHLHFKVKRKARRKQLRSHHLTRPQEHRVAFPLYFLRRGRPRCLAYQMLLPRPPVCLWSRL